jgi:hypothetical protein
MAYTLTLEVPTHIYKILLEKASMAGKTPERVVLEWVETVANEIDMDPLLNLAGVITSDKTDVSVHHDDYIGQELNATHA